MGKFALLCSTILYLIHECLGQRDAPLHKLLIVEREGGVMMGYYGYGAGAPVAGAGYAAPVAGYGYGAPVAGYGAGRGFALIVVLFILLIIIGASWTKY